MSKPFFKIFGVLITILMLFAFAACSDDDEDSAVTISLTNIAITAPMNSGTPQATITATTQYSGTITWAPDHTSFKSGTNYVATVTLTPSNGFTVKGLPENAFLVAGAEYVSNEADSGVITVGFPPAP